MKRLHKNLPIPLFISLLVLSVCKIASCSRHSSLIFAYIPLQYVKQSKREGQNASCDRGRRASGIDSSR
jgi:hypothetical protein